MNTTGESGGGPEAGGSFEARLRAARQRQGLDGQPGGKDQSGSAGNPLASLGVAMRLGVELVSALFVGVAIGWLLDRWLHTGPFLLILFILLGGAAGVVNVWRLTRPGGPIFRQR